MRHAQFAKRYLSRVLLTAVMAGMLAAGASAWENPLKGRYLSGGPLTICDQGSFFVGGVPKVDGIRFQLPVALASRMTDWSKPDRPRPG